MRRIGSTKLCLQDLGMDLPYSAHHHQLVEVMVLDFVIVMVWALKMIRALKMVLDFVMVWALV